MGEFEPKEQESGPPSRSQTYDSASLRRITSPVPATTFPHVVLAQARHPAVFFSFSTQGVTSTPRVHFEQVGKIEVGGPSRRTRGGTWYPGRWHALRRTSDGRSSVPSTHELVCWQILATFLAWQILQFLQFFGGLVLGCIKTKCCEKICV